MSPVDVRTQCVAVANRGTSAKPDVINCGTETDCIGVSVDAVWLGRASSIAALHDIATKFSAI